MSNEEPFDVVNFIIAAENGELGPLETLEGFGHLVKTGLVNGLQGSWQRAVREAIMNDLITEDGDLTDTARATFGDLGFDGEEL